jgi:hypothetical protein
VANVSNSAHQRLDAVQDVEVVAELQKLYASKGNEVASASDGGKMKAAALTDVCLLSAQSLRLFTEVVAQVNQENHMK